MSDISAIQAYEQALLADFDSMLAKKRNADARNAMDALYVYAKPANVAYDLKFMLLGLEHDYEPKAAAPVDNWLERPARENQDAPDYNRALAALDYEVKTSWFSPLPVATAILGAPIFELELAFDAACYIDGVWDSLLSEVLESAIWDLPKDCRAAIQKFVYALPTEEQNCYGLNQAEINLIACLLGTGTNHEVYLRARLNRLSENVRTILHTLAVKVVSAFMTGACKQKSKRIRSERALAIWDFIARRAQDVARLKVFCSFSAQVLGH